MALTLEAEQRMVAVSPVALFTAYEADWKAAAQRTKDFLTAGFPAGSKIRPDDVAKALHPIIEVDARLKTKLATAKLTQKYWVSYFTDLIIDRVWPALT